MLTIDLDQINKSTNKKIIILDFDLTITDIHTGGRINYDLLYWNSSDNFNLLVKTLQKIKSFGWLIYIVSRGISSNIRKYLDKLNILNLFEDIYGAQDQDHLSQGTNYWARYKTEYINQIVKINNINKTNIFFIDDTEENINYAISNGYANSILLNSLDCVSSICLVSILEKIILKNK